MRHQPSAATKAAIARGRENDRAQRALDRADATSRRWLTRCCSVLVTHTEKFGDALEGDCHLCGARPYAGADECDTVSTPEVCVPELGELPF